jgi:hypothetical protein
MSFSHGGSNSVISIIQAIVKEGTYLSPLPAGKDTKIKLLHLKRREKFKFKIVKVLVSSVINYTKWKRKTKSNAIYFEWVSMGSPT